MTIYFNTVHRYLQSHPVPEGPQWRVATEADIQSVAAASIIPTSITRRQARLALLHAGKLAAVESAIATIADPIHQMAAQIEYENATWERGNPWIEQLGAQIGLTPADIDQLFITAANL